MRKHRRHTLAAQQAWANGYKSQWVPMRWYSRRNPRRTGAAMLGGVGVVHTVRFTTGLNA
jgi:hypothetical protein